MNWIERLRFILHPRQRRALERKALFVLYCLTAYVWAIIIIDQLLKARGL